MKLEFIKKPGGTLVPANAITTEKMQRIKQDAFVTAEIRQPRNASFHRKAFALVNKAYEYWNADNTDYRHMDAAAQFEKFRGDLTILAGYREVVIGIKGEQRLVPKSWSFGSMSQDEFEAFYTALWNAIAEHVTPMDEADWMMEF